MKDLLDKETKQHWLVEGLNGVNILAFIALLLGAAWYIFEVRSGQIYMSEKVLTLEAEVDAVRSRETQIAQLTWRVDLNQATIDRMVAKLDRLEETQRNIMADIKDMQREVMGR